MPTDTEHDTPAHHRDQTLCRRAWERVLRARGLSSGSRIAEIARRKALLGRWPS